MVSNKHITKYIAVLMAVAAILCVLAVGFSDSLVEAFGGTGVSMEYETELFDTDEIITVNIIMDEDEWNEMIENALSEEYYVCDVEVNGTKFENVAIRPKGNTSLSSIVSDPDSDRFSLKLEFDHFNSGQSCFGLDKLILNNNYADATNMKEAIIYDMYQYLGADASLYNYASVSVNGEYWGVYLALEGVEESFMLRNYGTQDGELYKPDSMEIGGDNGSSDSSSGGFGGGQGDPGGSFGGMTPPSGGFGFGGPGGQSDSGEDDSPDGSERPSFGPGNMPDMGSFSFEDMPDMGDFDMGNFSMEDMPDMGDFDPSEMGDFSFGGFSMGGGGANLNYTDDDLDSYSTIWDGAITDSGKSDHKRVVNALKNISEGTDIEEYMDVDNILKYMAVHTFAVNMDSLSGTMAHNYYLYEYDGQLNIIPWDYNLSFGGMSMGGGSSATDTINDAIDTPFSSTEFFDALLSNEEYLEKYHEYLRQLVEEYVYGGRFEEVYSRIRSRIDSLVEEDPTAFYSYDEYLVAADMLYEVIELRADSISGQLDGSIPSTDSGQRSDSSSLIDASHLDLDLMGTMNMGGGGDDESGHDRPDSSADGQDADGDAESSERSEGRPEGGFGGFGGGDMPGFGGGQGGPGGNMPGFGGGDMPDFSGGFPDGGSFPGMPGRSPGISNVKTYIGYGAGFIAMVAALLVFGGLKRRKMIRTKVK